MPLTDFLKNFLQKLPENVRYLGTSVAPIMGPNWQQAIQSEQQRQMQLAAGQQQQANLDRQFGAQQTQLGTQNQLAQGHLMSQLLEKGFFPQGAQPQQTAGGPGLNDGGATPSFGMGGGQGAAPEIPNGPPGQKSTDDVIDMLQPGWRAFSGQQQQGGHAMNAPGQIAPGGAPAQRMPGMGGDSGGGGAIQPSGGMNIPGLPGMPMIPPQPTRTQSLPDPIADYFKMPHGAQMPAQQFASMMDTWAREQAATSKTKAPNEQADMQQTAAQLTAKDKGLTGTFNRISDLPLEHQAAAWEKDRELRSTEADKVNKQLAIQNQKDHEEKYTNEKLSDGEVINDIQRDPQAWFSLKDKDQQARIRQLAAQQGVRLPTREVKPQGQMADSLVAADTVQQQVARMRQIATALGPSSFGAMVGRLKNAEGEWGEPVFTDPMRAQLEEEFRGYSRNLSAQEAKLVGGGRTSVVIYNAIKGVTPGQWMDPSILEGAFRQASNRAQVTKNAINRWQFGDIQDPFKDFNSPIGQFGTINGKRVKVTGHDPKTGQLTYQEAPAQ